MGDLRLPNGTIIKNVPDDMPKHAIAMRAIREGLATNEDFGYDSGMGELGAAGDTKLGRLREGIGRGFVNTGRQVGNILGLVSDEEMEDAAELDRDLMNTGMGITGDIIGSLAATAPVGGVVGGAAKGLQAAGTGGRLARAADLAGRTLAHPAGRGAVEGAAYGSLYAGPGKRGEGATWGAGMGLGMGSLVRGLGNAWKNGKIALEEGAEQSAKELGTFIPISQAGREGGLPRMIYNAVLSNLPGSAGKVRGQYKDATGALRHWMGTKAVPEEHWLPPHYIDPGDKIHTIMRKLDDFWKGNPETGMIGAYEQIGAGSMNASRINFSKTTRDLVLREADSLGVPMHVPQGVNSKIQNVLNFRNTLTSVRAGVQKSPYKNLIKSQLGALDDSIAKIDDQLKKQLPDDVHEAYLALKEPYQNYKVLMGAVDKAKSAGQEFTPPQLLVAAAEKAGALARSGGGSTQQVANRAVKSLIDFPSKAGVYQVVASIGLTSGLMGMFLGTGLPALTAAGIYGVAKLVGTKKFQQFLMGSFRGKAALEHPAMKDLFRVLGYSARQQAAMQIAEDL